MKRVVPFTYPYGIRCFKETMEKLGLTIALKEDFYHTLGDLRNSYTATVQSPAFPPNFFKNLRDYGTQDALTEVAKVLLSVFGKVWDTGDNILTKIEQKVSRHKQSKLETI